MNSEGLILKWNDFEQNASSTFKSSKGNLEFSDVTLVAEDGQQMEAHKLIISSGCEFFTNMFNINRAGHTVVFMRGIKFEVLSAIVDFIYSGETKISRKDLTDFITVADELKLKGLSKEKTLEEYENSKEKILEEYENGIKDSMNEAIKNELNQDCDNPKEDSMDYIDSRLNENAFSKEALIKETNYTNDMENFQLSDLISQIIDGSKDIKAREVAMNLMLANLGGQWTCPICDNACKTKQSLRTHIEGLHCSRELNYTCNTCKRICRSKHALACHMSNKHRIQATPMAKL